MRAPFGRILAGAFYALLVSIGRAEEAGPPFLVSWNASDGLLPSEARPVWLLNGTADSVAKGRSYIEKGQLIFKTPLTQLPDVKSADRIYINKREWNPLPDHGSTIEFVVQVESVAVGGRYAAAIGFVANGLAYRFSFNSTGISNQEGEQVEVTTNQPHLYRITLDEKGVAEVFLDGKLPALLQSKGTQSDRAAVIYFGVLGKLMGGESSWRFVRFTNRGVYRPNET